MKLELKNFPNFCLPYDDVSLCRRMMVRLYEKISFCAELPNLESKDTTLSRTIENIPIISIRNGFYELNTENDTARKYIPQLDRIYNDESLSELDKFKFTRAPYYDSFKNLIELNRADYAVIKFIGVFSLLNMMTNSGPDLITDKLARKLLIQIVSLKAAWAVKQIKTLSKKVVPIILFDEPMLYKFGTLKRKNPDITNELIISTFAKVFTKIKSLGGVVGVNSSEKCNWQLVTEANADFISFDAYNNPNNLNIIAEEINDFLSKGGFINWAIIPTINENTVKQVTVDYIEKRLFRAMDELASNGVHRDLLYRNSTVSTNGNLSHLDVFFAEKALMLSNQISKRLAAAAIQRPV